MKTKAPHSHSSSSNSHSSKPFFNRSGGESFFSNSSETEHPFFSPSLIQTKLTIGQPHDKYEQEADQVAEKVVQKLENPTSSKPIQRKCENCMDEEKLQKTEEDTEEMEIMRKPTIDSGNDPQIQNKSFESRLNITEGKGKPLSSGIRPSLESAFGADFSSVKIHTDSTAIQMNQELGARAFTHGSNVYFNKGEYAPESTKGRKLLAHELTHVIQQKSLPKLIQKQGFSSTMEICHRILRSPRVFRISRGGIRITTNAWTSVPLDPPRCEDHRFHIDVIKIGFIDQSYGSCDFSTSSQPASKAWGGLPEGDYRLEIFRMYDNPYCCLEGTIEVTEESGVQGGSCTELPPGPLEIVHYALQAAGMIPALGIIPDAIDAGVYLIEGNWVNAGISGAAMVPIFGQGATVTRFGVRVTREAIERTGREGIERGLRAARLLRRIPQGFTERQFRRFARGARRLHRQARLPSGELVVQGSRARGAARASSDIDVALRIDENTFFELAQQALARARPGTRLRETMLRRVRRGQLSSFDLGQEFQALRREFLDSTSHVPVQFSVIKRGGSFDTGPFIPLN